MDPRVRIRMLRALWLGVKNCGHNRLGLSGLSTQPPRPKWQGRVRKSMIEPSREFPEQRFDCCLDKTIEDRLRRLGGVTRLCRRNRQMSVPSGSAPEGRFAWHRCGKTKARGPLANDRECRVQRGEWG